LGGVIRSGHGDLDQLKSNFSATALGMISPGCVWFVTDRNGQTGVLPTFSSGTLLVRSRTNVSPILPERVSRKSPDERIDEDHPSSELNGPRTPPNPFGQARSVHRTSLNTTAASIHNADRFVRTEVELPTGDLLYPLFCLSLNEHAWISAGYGVWGKEEWLKKFWTVLDWGKVSQAYEKLIPDQLNQ
jgi:superoxide dismutase, Fe-Mn family